MSNLWYCYESLYCVFYDFTFTSHMLFKEITLALTNRNVEDENNTCLLVLAESLYQMDVSPILVTKLQK